MKKIAKTLLGGVLTLALALGLMPAVNVQADDTSYITIHYYADTTQSAVYAYAASATWNESGSYDWSSISGYESYMNDTGVQIYENAYNDGWYDVTIETTNVGTYLAVIFTDGSWGSYQFGDLLVDPELTEVWITCDWNTSYADDYARLYIDSSYATAPTDWDDGSDSGYVISLTPSATSITAGGTVTVTATILDNGVETALSDDMAIYWWLDNYKDETAGGLIDGTPESTNGVASVDFTLPSVGTYYVYVELQVDGNSYTSYTAITTKEAATYDTTTVYFDNTNSAWSSVYLYMTDSNWAKMEGYEDYATWPGVQLTANSSGLYEVSIPDNLDVYLIFNDGTGGTAGETQTSDLLHEAKDGTRTYSIASEAATTTSDASVASSYFSSGVATAVTTISVESDATYDESTGLTAVEIASAEDLEEGVTYVVVVDGTAYEAYVEDGVLYIKGDVTSYDLDGLTVYAERENTTTVYFTNTEGWESVYVYITDSAWSPIEGLEDYATWPGVKLTAKSDGLYEVTIPDDIGVYLIFSDGTGGAGAQTNDLLHEAGTGSVTYNADGSDIKTAEDDGSNTTSSKKTADATPIIPIAVALLGCAVIAVSSKRRAA